MNQTRAASKQGWVIALTSAASFMFGSDLSLVAAALPSIRRTFGASVDALPWTVNAFTLSFAALVLPGAALGDRFGRRRMFVVGIALFIFGCALSALSPTMSALIAGRAVQGIGAGLMIPLSVTLIGAAFSPQQRGRALGIFFGAQSLGAVLGVIAGGGLSQGTDWHLIFWINVPVGLTAIAVALAQISETRGSNKRFDVAGAVLATAAVLGIVWGLARGNVAGWSSAVVAAPLLGGVILLGAFVLWELRVGVPMLQMGLFRLRAFSAGNAVSLGAFAATYGMFFFVAQYIQNVLGFGPFDGGLRLLPFTVAALIASPIAGALADRFDTKSVAAAGTALQLIGVGSLGPIARAALAYDAMVVPMILVGVGVSFALPAAQKAVVGAVKLEQIGQAAGSNTTIRVFGGSLGIAIATAAFSGAGGYASPVAFTDGFVAAMWAMAVLSAVGLVAAIALPGRRASAKTTPRPDMTPTAAQESHPRPARD